MGLIQTLLSYRRCFVIFIPERDNSKLANPHSQAKALPRPDAQGKFIFQALSFLLLSPFSAPSTHCFLHQEVAAKETMTAPGHEVFCTKQLFHFYVLSSKSFPTLAHHETNFALSIYP